MLELEQLACVRGATLLFRGVSAHLARGQLLRVTGANGAGKTSLLRMLCGLTAPSAGQIRWQEQTLARVREPFARDLLYVGHAAALKDDLSALENLQAAETLAGRPVTVEVARVALAQAGLQERATLPARRLSQGQRKRVHLARLALPTAPLLWILDEPFNALDAEGNAWLQQRIATHIRQGGMTVLTSHQPLTLDAGHAQQVLAL